jgi:hypothetical protein
MLPGVCLKVKPVGKPDAVAPHVRFDERGRETGLCATAPVLDSTHKKGGANSLSVFLFDNRIRIYFWSLNLKKTFGNLINQRSHL